MVRMTMKRRSNSSFFEDEDVHALYGTHHFVILVGTSVSSFERNRTVRYICWIMSFERD